MKSGNKDIEELSKAIGKTSAGEHLLNLLKAGLSSAPFCGGIASLMSDYIPSTKQKRMEEFVKMLSEDLIRLQEHVNENLLLTDDFAFMFEKCFRGVAENYQQEKLKFFRGILVNSTIGFNASIEEREYFVNLVNSLSPLHLRVLKFMAMPQVYLEEMNLNTDNLRGGFSEMFEVAIPGVDIEVIKSAFGDLYQNGLIGTDKSIFTTMTSGQGFDLLGDGSRVKELGKKFVKFGMVPSDV